jgi:hypothetical protein
MVWGVKKIRGLWTEKNVRNNNNNCRLQKDRRFGIAIGKLGGRRTPEGSRATVSRYDHVTRDSTEARRDDRIVVDGRYITNLLDAKKKKKKRVTMNAHLYASIVLGYSIFVFSYRRVYTLLTLGGVRNNECYQMVVKKNEIN